MLELHGGAEIGPISRSLSRVHQKLKPQQWVYLVLRGLA